MVPHWETTVPMEPTRSGSHRRSAPRHPYHWTLAAPHRDPQCRILWSTKISPTLVVDHCVLWRSHSSPPVLPPNRPAMVVMVVWKRKFPIPESHSRQCRLEVHLRCQSWIRWRRRLLPLRKPRNQWFEPHHQVDTVTWSNGKKQPQPEQLLPPALVEKWNSPIKKWNSRTSMCFPTPIWTKVRKRIFPFLPLTLTYKFYVCFDVTEGG